MGEVILVILIVAFSLIFSRKKGKPGSAVRGASRNPRAAFSQDTEKVTYTHAPASSGENPKALFKNLTEMAGIDLDDLIDGLTDEEGESDFVMPAKLPKQRLRAKPAAVQMKAPLREIVSSVQGVSAMDEEGCVGGSMPHSHEEGERRAEHAEHLYAAGRQSEMALNAHAVSQELNNANIEQLRRAVIMAEILDRPKALRRPVPRRW